MNRNAADNRTDTNKKEKFINKNNAVHKRFWQIGIRTFFVFLFVIAFIGLLLPLRPKESELEKRELSNCFYRVKRRIFLRYQHLVRGYVSVP